MSSRQSGTGPSSRAKLLLELGRGGMGTVYLAAAQGPAGFTKLKVIKRLRADLASDPQFLQMFLEEARLAARLSHPNIVQTNDVGFDGVHYFIEMEYLEGVTLDAFLRVAGKRGGCPLPLGLWVLTQVLEGLHYAHELTGTDKQPLRIVHRDVSPHNVLVTYDGGVKLLDFGIAKAADSTLDTATGVVKGKVTYMAPEQAARRPVDRRADVFSAGVILWQMLTGRGLWSDLSDAEIYVRLEKGELPAPSTVKTEVPETLETICMRALAREPEARYPTAGVLQHDIEAYLEATAARTGRRALAAAVGEWFAAARAAIKFEIEQQLEAAIHDPGVRAIDVLPAGFSRSPAETPSGSLTSSKTLPEASDAPVRPESLSRERIAGAPTIRPRRLLWAAATVVLLSGTMLWLWRGASRASHTSSAPFPEAPSSSGSRCASTLDCLTLQHSGQVCRRADGACVALESAECHVLASAEDLASARTIWFGSMLSTKPGAVHEGERELERAIELARRDFEDVAHGLPPARNEEGRRGIGVVACDDTHDAQRVARHLIDDVGVPAVIGFGNDDEVLDLVTRLFNPAGVLTMATANTSTLLTDIPRDSRSPRLVWRTSVSAAQWAKPTALLVSDVYEHGLRESGLVSRAADIRVAMLRDEGNLGMAFGEALVDVLRFNGKSVVENGRSFRRFIVKGPADDAEVASSLLEWRPHVIVLAGSWSRFEPVIAEVEYKWADAALRPRYAQATMFSPRLVEFMAARPDLRHRFLALSTPANTEINAKVTFHYNDAFTDEPTTLAQSPSTAYDAFYVLAYATLAAGDRAITGTELSRGIARLVAPGVRVDVGPTHIFEAYAALQGGQNVDLIGTTSALDFDPTTGEAPADEVVMCAALDERGTVYDSVESGLRYDAKGQRLTGSLKCP